MSNTQSTDPFNIQPENPFAKKSRLVRSPTGKDTPKDGSTPTNSEKRFREEEDILSPSPKRSNNTNMQTDSEALVDGREEIGEDIDVPAILVRLETITRNCYKNKSHITGPKINELAEIMRQLKKAFHTFQMNEVAYKARLSERTCLETTVKELIATRQTPTYAQKASATPIQTLSQGPRPQGKTLLLFPKNENQSSEEVKQLVKEKIRPKTQNIQVHRLSKIRNGGIAIEVQSDRETEFIRETLAEHLDVRTPVKRKPRIILFSIDKTYSEDELLEEIHLQNFKHLSFNNFSDNFKLKFKTGPRQQSTVNWVAECSPGLYREITLKGKVFLDWTSARVSVYKAATRCYKCQKYGHLSKDCKSQVEICGHCAGSGHDRLNCPLTRLPPKCANCPKGKADHSVHGKSCPSYINELNRLDRLTDYGD